jgi:hypothetical protein
MTTAPYSQAHGISEYGICLYLNSHAWPQVLTDKPQHAVRGSSQALPSAAGAANRSFISAGSSQTFTPITSSDSH